MESNEPHRDSQGQRDITGDRTMPELAEGLGCGPMSSKIKERRRTAPRKPPFQAGRRRAEPSPNLTSPSASPLATEERGNGASSNSACRRCGWPLSHGGPQDALSQPPDRVVRARYIGSANPSEVALCATHSNRQRGGGSELRHFCGAPIQAYPDPG